MSISERIDQHLSYFEDIARLEDLLRPRAWPPGFVGELPHLHAARRSVRYLHSLARARERGRMSGKQAARYADALRRVRGLWPFADGAEVPALLRAHLRKPPSRAG